MENRQEPSDKKRILVVGPVYPYRGGIAHFTMALAEALKRSGHQVDLISYKWQYPAFLYPGKSDKDPSQARAKPKADYLLSPLNPCDWRKTFARIQSAKPDLVIFPWWVSIWAPAYAWLFKKLNRAGIPFKVLVHNTYPHEAKTIDRWLARYGLSHAHAFVTLNTREATKLRALLGDDRDIRTVPHPIYQAFPPSGMTKTEICQKLGLDPSKPVILFFGFVRPYKGLDLLLEATAHLKQRQVPAQVLIVGEFWEPLERYHAQIQNLGIGHLVRIFPEYISDEKAGQFFEVADCFAAPYRDATQSGSVKLALGYGLPVVISDVVADEFLRGLKQGCAIVPVEDVQNLSEALKTCLATTPTETKNDLTIQETWQALIESILEPRREYNHLD